MVSIIKGVDLMHTALTLVAAATVLLFAETANAGLIYFDDFSGSSSSDLNATAPDTRPGWGFLPNPSKRYIPGITQLVGL